MDIVQDMQGTLNALAVQIGAGTMAAGISQQQFNQATVQFIQLKTELVKECAKVRKLEKQNRSMKAAIAELGYQVDDAEEEEEEEGEVMDEPSTHTVMQRAVGEANQANTICTRCAPFDDEALSAATYRDPITCETCSQDARKPICEYCWQMRLECGPGPECQSCVNEEVTCEFHLCDGGARCARPRCMRLHPSQWDPTDDRWIVVEGRMPLQGGEVAYEQNDRP